MRFKQVGKRFLAAFLSISMVFGMAPTRILAAGTDKEVASSLVSTTNTNVDLIIDYARQMREKNTIGSSGFGGQDYHSGGFSWDTEKKSDSWRYFNGVMFDAFLMVDDYSNTTVNKEYVNTVYSGDSSTEGILSIDENGNIKIDEYKKSNMELDSIEPARPLFDLLDNSADGDIYEKAIQNVYHQLTTQESFPSAGGNFLHKPSWNYWKIGLDGIYMAQPFLMEVANAVSAEKMNATFQTTDASGNTTNNITVNPATVYSDVYNRLVWVADKMYDDTTHLYHHGNAALENNNAGLNSGHFWARGIGWYAAALVDVIELMPADQSTYRTNLISKLTKLYDGMLEYQDAQTGMWYNVVNRDSNLTGNKLETSGTAMMAYSMMKAYNNDWVTEDKYAVAALKAFNGIVANKVTGAKGSNSISVEDIYKSSSVCDNDGGYCDSSKYVSDEAKGTAVLIMAATLANTTASKLNNNSSLVSERTEKEELEILLKDATWESITKTITDGVYKRVRNVDTSNRYGYVMADSDATTSLAYENGSLSDSTITASGDVLTATGANNLWFIDKTKLYTEVDGLRKYLNMDSTNNSAVMEDAGKTNWTVNVNPNNTTGVIVTTTIDNAVYYLNSDGTISTTLTDITLWSKVPATVTDVDKAVLYGTTAYSVAAGEDVQFIIEDIKEQVKVYYRGKMNQDIQELSWSNNNISCPWNMLNTENPGTYTLPVKYNNVSLGTIQVTVGTATEAPIEWKDVESTSKPDTYSLVQNMDSNHDAGYVISKSDTTMGSKQVLSRQSDNIESTDNTAKSVTYKSYDESSCEISDIDSSSIWMIDDSGKIFSFSTDKKNKYYFQIGMNSSISLKIACDDNNASSWECIKSSNDCTILITYTGLENDQKCKFRTLECDSSDNVFKIKNSERKVAIWARTPGYSLTTQAALAGKRTYNMPVGEELETIKTTIGASTKVYYKADATKEEYTELSLTDKNVVVGWDALRTDTAGTYTIPVSIQKADNTTVALGDITVKMRSVTPTQNPVQWVDIKDKVTQNDEYTLVRTMEETSDGYVIAVRGGQVGEIRTLGWTLSNQTPTYNNNTVLMVQSPNHTYGDNLVAGDTYLFQGVSDANLWYIEDVDKVSENVENANGESISQDAVEGYLYAKNGDQKYYLKALNTNGYITMTTDKSQADKWIVVESVRDHTSTYIRSEDANGKVALKGDSTKFNISSENNAVEIWKRTSGADSKIGQVSLGEKMEYTATTNASETDVLNSIKAGTKIYYRVNAEATTYEDVPWTDPNITYEWQNGFNTATAGTLGLVVKYAGVELGTIVVKVDNSDWVKIDRPVFKQVTTLEKGSEYGYLIIGNKKVDGKYSSLQRDIQDNYMTGLTKKIDISQYDKAQDLYTVSYSGTDNLWFYDSEGRLFAKTNLEHSSPSKYYLKAGNKNDELTVLTKDVTEDASTWTVSKSDEDAYAICLQADNDLFVRWDNGSFKMNESNWHIYAYQQTDLNAGGDATLTGTKEHTVRKGDTTFTEVSVKEAATILFKKSGNSYADFVNWDDASVTYSWTKTTESNGESEETEVTRFTTTEAGNYTMTVSYMGVQIGQITVTVQEPTVSSSQWSLPTNDTITTGIHSEPDFSDIKLTIQYSDGSTDVLTVKDGLTIEGDYNVNKAGTYHVTVKYGTYSHKIIINVDEDPYYGLETVTGSKLPSYPEEGAVRVKKDAYDDDTFAFRKTGVTEVELDVAGISSKNGVDVVLVVDVSNSMGWNTSWASDRSNLMNTAGMKDTDAKDWWKIPGADTYLTDRYGVKDGEAETITASDREKTYLEKVEATENDTITTTIDATATNTGDDKLDAAMDAAAKFAEKLLGSNEDGSYKNNSLSFVTFAGYDAQNYNGSESYIDSVQTVFTGVESEVTAKAVFDNTKFTSYTITDTVQTKDNEKSISTRVQYNLNLANLDGTVDSGQNRGNTNYDYGLSEAQNAVDAVRSQYGNSYDELGRHTIVLFMTDGAATHYNNERADGNNADRIYDYNIQYPSKGEYLYYNYDYDLQNPDTGYTSEDNTKENWEKFLLKPNKYAQKLDESVEAFYAVGFDLAHGGFSDFSWAGDTDTLKTVLTNMAGFDYSRKPNVDDVQLVDDYEELNGFFEMIASKIQMPGREAQVEDMIHSDYSLQIGSVSQTDNEFHLSKIDGFMPSIQVKSYKLYTAADNAPGLIGQRKEGDGNVTVIETVTFEEITDSEGNVTDIKAYSNLVDDGKTNILTLKTGEDSKYLKDEEGRLIPETINAKTFTYDYTKDVDYDGRLDEMFYWRLDETSGEKRGNITEDEYALSYYVYLEEALYEEAPAETYDDYDTNEYAKLEYIDIDGNHAVREFPVPDRAWGSAKTEVEFYLVNQSGVPINLDTGEEVTFDTRYKINVPTEFSDDLVKTFLYSNEGIGFTAKELSAYLPSGYKMYNENASYTVTVPDTEQGSLTISHDPETVNKYGEYTTQRFDTNTNDYSHTKVAFAVVLVDQIEVSKKLSLDRVVIDYGKPVQVNVLENDKDNKEADYSYQVVGFAAYNSDPSYIHMTQGNPGQTTYTGRFGQFSLVEGNPNRVQYTPTKMLSQVEKVFTVVKAQKGARIYYLYQELEVIPATNVYYETDFAENVFTFAQANDTNEDYAWQKKTDNTNQSSLSVKNPDKTIRSDSIQDDGLVRLEDVTVNGVTSKKIKADQTYGYDESYTNDSDYSNGTSWFVKGKGVKKTKTSFSFTGTGFDLISRTGPKQGSVRVDVYSDQALENRVKSVTVLNKSESNLELFQIPVVTIEGLEHGTYYVEIGVSLPVTDQELDWLNRGDEFYFDAIRVYNPIDVTGVDIRNLDVEASTTVTTATDSSGVVTETVTEYTSNQIAALVYHGHKELYPYATEVRNHLISAASFGYDGVNGAIFVDRYYDQTGNVVFVADYKTIGPNNEVYLAKGQAIAFQINTSNLSGVDVGVKAPMGTAAALEAVISRSGYQASDVGNVQNNVTKNIASATEQFIDLMEGSSSVTLDNIMEEGSAYVVIKNTGEGMLSVTDVKLTYTEQNTEEPSFSVNSDVKDYAFDFAQ